MQLRNKGGAKMKKRLQRQFDDAVCQPFYLEGKSDGKRHGVLLIHGFTGTAAHMRPIAEALHAQGFTVMGINLPGHATDMDDMARTTWEEWLDAAKAAVFTLQQQCEFVSVAGLSMGGCLSLLIAEQMQPTAIAPISAPMGTQQPLWLAALASPLIDTIWWKSRDEEGMPILNAYDYGYPGFRSKCARHLARLIKLSRRDLHAITCPVLVIQSHADETIIAESADIILSGISSERSGVLWLENAPHVCTITQEAANIAAALAEHFRQAEGQ